MSKKNRRKMVVRSKRDYPTVRRAMRSLERAGYQPHQLVRADHTGNYWRWEIA